MYPDSVHSELMVYRKTENGSSSYFLGGRQSTNDPFKNYFANEIDILKLNPDESTTDEFVLAADHCEFSEGRHEFAQVFWPQYTDHIVVWSYAYVQSSPGCGENGGFLFRFSDEPVSCVRLKK